MNQQLQNHQGPVLGPADIAQPLPLLQELQSSWRRSRFGRSGRRSSGSGGYLRELGRGEQGL